jgi:hypothetical protein
LAQRWVLSPIADFGQATAQTAWMRGPAEK